MIRLVRLRWRTLLLWLLHVAEEWFGIADVMTWPWIHAAVGEIGLTLDGTRSLARWYVEIAERPTVRRGLEVPRLEVP